MHKKGVSEIISYVLLIVIAVGASVLVYNLLLAIIPHKTVTCPQDIYLVIKDYRCSYSGHELNITLVNKGRFSVDAAYVRIGKSNASVGTWINPDGTRNFYFGSVGRGLAPNHEASLSFDISQSPANNAITGPNNYSLTIQPAMWDKELKKTAACLPVVSQTIQCI